DKTGTLTTNRLRLARLVPLGGHAEQEARELLRLFACASLDRQNKSLQALRDALGEARAGLLDQIPFKSQNRYSAVCVRAGGREHTLALGACEALGPRLEGESGGWREEWQKLQATGLRLLLFAECPKREAFNGSLDGFPLWPVALVALSDELRPEAGGVLEAFAAQGIRFKIISGDNADTVRATVGGLKLPLASEPVVAGDQLAAAQE